MSHTELLAAGRPNERSQSISRAPGPASEFRPKGSLAQALHRCAPGALLNQGRLHVTKKHAVTDRPSHTVAGERAALANTVQTGGSWARDRVCQHVGTWTRSNTEHTLLAQAAAQPARFSGLGRFLRAACRSMQRWRRGGGWLRWLHRLRLLRLFHLRLPPPGDAHKPSRHLTLHLYHGSVFRVSALGFRLSALGVIV